MGIPPPLETASLGLADSVILMVLGVVAIWPRRLPQISRQLGRLYEFRKVSNDFKFQMGDGLWAAEGSDRREEGERQGPLEFAAPSQPVVASLSTGARSLVPIDATAEAAPAVVNDEVYSDKSGATEQATDNG